MIRAIDENGNWTNITYKTKQTSKVNCKEDKEICSQFLVAHIPFLEYSDY